MWDHPTWERVSWNSQQLENSHSGKGKKLTLFSLQKTSQQSFLKLLQDGKYVKSAVEFQMLAYIEWH